MRYTMNCQQIISTRAFSDHTLRSKVLVVGTGWSGFRAARDLDKRKFDVKLVSPRNHFLFTPLLPSTAVGTLEFRTIQEPARTIPDINFYQAYVDQLDFDSRTAFCKDAFIAGHQFELKYDYLILAAGCETNTFNIKGVEGSRDVFFLKQLSDARAIRNRLIECFERASSPAVSEKEKQRLLTFIVVGGGPTNVEFAAELFDFIQKDVSRWYPDLYQHANVKIVEASGHILGTFHDSIVSYVEKLFHTRKVDVMTGKAVSEIRGNEAVLQSGEVLPFGLLVWSAGIRPASLIRSLSSSLVSKSPQGRLLVDPFLRVLKAPSSSSEQQLLGGGRVFAMGDCAVDARKPLPALAQVANQQGRYLAAALNQGMHNSSGSKQLEPFKYRHLGSMASVGDWKGVYDSTNSLSDHASLAPPVKGFMAFLLWRAAYWTEQVSLRNKVLIPMYWFKSAIFGRDISSF